MKKIRIEKKSGELVVECEGFIEDGSMNFKGVCYVVKWFENTFGLIVKEIEVEEKKPVVRWLWVHDIDENNKYFESGKFYTEEEMAEANKTRSCKFYKKLEWSRTEFPS